MCILLLSRKHPAYKLILLSNRDEFFSRASAPAHWWPEYASSTGLLAGKDTLRGGTWLALSRNGRIAGLTNYREAQQMVGERSRGALPVQFVASTLSTDDFMTAQLEEGEAALQSYGGFSLLCGDLSHLEQGLSVLSNRSAEAGIVRVLHREAGEHTDVCELSNAEFGSPWQKVQQGRAMLDKVITRHAEKDDQAALVADLMDVLSTDSLAKPDVASMQGSIFIPEIPLANDSYGTRQQTVVLVSQDNQVTFIEQTRSANKGPLSTVRHDFTLSTH